MDNKKGIKCLSERQLLAREALLNNLKEEINTLEFNIENINEHNKKIRKLRQKKISLCFLQKIAPYLATAGFTLACFSALSATPFYRDDVKRILKTRKELDSQGNTKYEEQYGNFETTEGKLTYVGKWNKEDDEFYTRKVVTYDVRYIDDDVITKIVNNIEVAKLEDIFGLPINEIKETKNNLTEEELNADEYIEAIWYLEDVNDYIIAKETVSNNFWLTLFWVIVTAFCETIPLSQASESSIKYENAINEIRKRYPYLEKEELLTKLDIKRNNYKVLSR